MSQLRLNILSALMGFKIGFLPFVYLGVPLFKGKPKAFCYVLLRIKSFLYWPLGRVRFFYFIGRVELVKSVVQSMLLHKIGYL